MSGGRLPRKLGETAVPMTPVPAGTPLAEIVALLRDDPDRPGVLIDSPTGPRLLSRSSRTLHDPLVLPAGTDIDLAAEAALARPDAERDEPVVVRWPDDRYGVAPVIGLLTAMAGRYARMSRADHLTGLPNRATVVAEGRQRLAAGTLAAIVHLGLDRFQEVNDMLGREGADTLLQRVAGALRDACRPQDLIARFEGDQFAVLVAHPVTDAARLGRRLADAIRGPHTIDGVPVSLEASVGVTEAGHRDIAVVGRRAVAAMHSAKKDRTGVVRWTEDLGLGQRADLRQLTELRAGIRAGHLLVQYQPLHDAADRTVRGAEALVRWQHPQRGMLPPGVFLPDAERSDVILELTDWVLAEAIHQAGVWHREGRGLPVSVNLSAAYLAQDRAVPTILALLRLEGLPASLLTVEITETAVLTRPDRAAARLAEIRAAGIRVAIDDFGTGYTSLGLLPELPIDELKIDRSFVMRMHDSKPHAVIIDSVIAIARALNLTVVAEGVEDEPTATALAEAGVDLLQGYHLNRPGPAELVHPNTRLSPVHTRQ
ncbi:diguanylate cyclase (GGDEF) domain-containing protein [Paractinoplanes atraurantiacus]|uniref:Diguanylate cyclase (GGDEF) domain-containing protein n=1 Tax=Paractinoplanes atraurantiacus TaxID=1036182 RepID=A0A285EXX6_9ACTN|nr:diguanylate cyclase (GGDEF) domain-containing protein [Actinoplanes atraurantiacus]